MTEKKYSGVNEKVSLVKSKIAAAAKQAGKSADDICLVGVTKTQSVEKIIELFNAGVNITGENKVQELIEKHEQLVGYEHKTHLIGHLQSNKAKFLPGKISMLQSLDSEKTIVALEKAYCDKNEILDILIQINIGDEASKNGIAPKELEQLANRVAASPVLRFRGIMAIPPVCEIEQTRRYFEQMNKLFVDIKSKKLDNKVNILSMGMSADYEYAIREGANMVRVGSELFGARL